MAGAMKFTRGGAPSLVWRKALLDRGGAQVDGGCATGNDEPSPVLRTRAAHREAETISSLEKALNSREDIAGCAGGLVRPGQTFAIGEPSHTP